MRAFFLLTILIATCGCTGSRASQRSDSDQTAHDTRIIAENPSLFDRLKFGRQKARRDAAAQPEVVVEGSVSH